MISDTPPPAPVAPASARPLKQRWIVQLLFMPILYGAVTFLAAGRLDWVWGWVFAAVYLISNMATLVLVRDEELIAERQRSAPDAEVWDRWTLKAFGLTYSLVAIVGGLDARFGWMQPWPAAVNVIGGLLILGATGLGLWAMRVNTFFSAIVRIQHERNHRVITSGPYRLIRHPGNLSMILWLAGAALLLGSGWALFPAAAGSLLAVWRTAREDRLLRARLAGYEAYAGRVRFRLLPPLW